MSEIIESAPPIWRDPHLLLSCSLGVLVIAAVAGIAPVLPRLAADLELPLKSVGLVLSSFMLPGLVAAPAAGFLADRFGRNPVLVISLVVLGVFGCGCALSFSSNMLLFMRFLAGCGAGGVSVMSLTILGARFKGKELASATALFGFVQTSATAVLPWLGGALGQYSWRTPMFLAAFAFPLALWAVWLRGDREHKKGVAAVGFKDMIQAVDRRLGAILVVELVNFALLTGALLTYVPVLLKAHFSAGPEEIGRVVAFAAVISAFAALSTKRLSGFMPARLVVCLGFALYVPAYLLAPMAGSVGIFLVAAAFMGAGRGVNLPTLIRMVNDEAPDDRRSVCNAAYLFVLRAGQTAGPIIAGLVYAAGGLTGVFYFDAVVSALTAVCALKLLPVSASGGPPGGLKPFSKRV